MLKEKDCQGFTLVECVIAMVIVTIGFAAVFSLMAFCLKIEVISRELRVANSLSRLKIEELKNSVLIPGGSLTSDVTDYCDYPTATYTRRWQIIKDTTGTQTVSVLIIPEKPDALLPEVKLITRMN